MKYLQIFTVLTVLLNISLSMEGQSNYNEDEVRKLLDKYIKNPKLYYDKVNSLNERAAKANENTLKVSEEYLSLLDKKDSLIKIYKNKAIKATRLAAAASKSPKAATTEKPKTTTIVTKVAGEKNPTPYRVQLAAYFREDFSKFFGSFDKTLGITKLDNRNVIEVKGFQDENEAYEFSKKIQKLGFPGAFVTRYDENGRRQEDFTASESTSFGGVTRERPKRTNSKLEYPDYIPIGYKELKGGNLTEVKQVVIAKKKPKPPTTKNIASTATTAVGEPNAKNAETITLRAPKSSTPIEKTSTSPKNIASARPVPTASSRASKPIAIPRKKAAPVKQSTRDQLDAAFDQLFKQ